MCGAEKNLSLKRQCHQRAGYKNSVNEGYLSGAGIPSEVLVAVCVQFCGVGWGLVTGGTFAERGSLTGVFDECGVLVEDYELPVSNFIRPTEERGEGGEGGELGTFSVVSGGHDCVGLLVGWFWCETRVRLEIEPWRAILAIRFLLLRLDRRGRAACQI